MKSMRMALLAAAALAVMPGAAWADRQNQPDRDNHGDRGDHGNRGGGGGDHARPAPPQAQHGTGMMVTPGSTPSGYHPNAPQPPQRQAQPQNRGNWRGPGAQGHGDVRIDRPARVPNADTGQSRGDNRYSAPLNDGRYGNNDNRSQSNDRQGRGDNRRFDNDNRNNNHGQWNSGNPRQDGHPNPGGHNWNGRTGGNDHRWDASHWRNDHRYDWRGWRNNHRNLFSRHYYGPRGYHYRSVYAGFFLEPLFYGSSYWLDDPFEYRLPPAEWPLHWVHYYNDALLVDVTTGEVVDVIPNFFYQ